MCKIILFNLVLFFSIYAQSRLEFFLPEHNQNDQIVRHRGYILKYNETHEQPEWVAYLLTEERVREEMERTDDYRPDPAVSTESAQLTDY